MLKWALRGRQPRGDAEAQASRLRLGLPRRRTAFWTLAAVLSAHFLGWLTPVDTWHRRQLARLAAPTPRSQAPVLVTLDAGLVQRWGPPPWSEAQWQTLAESLTAVGVRQATLLTTPERVLRQNRSASKMRRAQAAGATIRVPRFLRQSGRTDTFLDVSALGQRRGPLHPWPYQLYLPHQDGQLWDVQAAMNAGGSHGPSWLCAVARRCPSGPAMQSPLLPGAPPMVSATLLLDKALPLATRGRRILIGLTAPAFASFVTVGPHAEHISEAEALTRSASALHPPPRRPLPWWGNVLLLLLWLALWTFPGHALCRRDNRLHLLVGASAALMLTSLTYLFGALALPGAALLLLAALPPLLLLLLQETQIRNFASYAFRIVLQESFRHAPTAALVRGDAQLLTKLGALTRSYFETDDCAWFRRDAKTDSFTLAGAYGIALDDLSESAARGAHAAQRRAALAPSGGILADGIFADPARRCRLVPLRYRSTLLGLWCIPFRDSPPSVEIVWRLVAWLSPRLALAAQSGGSSAELGHGRIGQSLSDLQNLLATDSDERRRQHQVVMSLPTPMLVSDLSGMILYVNDALSELLLASGIGVVHSMRQLIFKLSHDENHGRDAASRLFKDGKQVHFAHTLSGKTWHIDLKAMHGSSAAADASAEAEHAHLGFIGIFIDMSLPEQLERVRRSVAAFIDNEVRNKVMVAQGQALRARQALGDSPAEAQLDRITHALEDIARVVDEMDLTVTPQDDPGRVFPLDIVELLQATHIESETQLLGRHQTLHLDTPDLASPVR
ncbi:MAG: hypothetical protein ACPGUV_07670, partial [Polyangiales bacterium]